MAMGDPNDKLIRLADPAIWESTNLNLLAEVAAMLSVLERETESTLVRCEGERDLPSAAISTSTSATKYNTIGWSVNLKKPRSTRRRRTPVLLPLLDQESSKKPSEETLKEKEEEEEDRRDSVQPIEKINIEKEEEDKKRKSNDNIIDEKGEEDNKKRRMMNAFIPRYRTFKEPQPEDLPVEFKRRIRSVGGDDFKFIIQKEITPSDVKKNNNRLSIPVRRVGSPEFLWDEEREKVREREGTKIKGLKVTLMVELDDHDHDHQSQRLILKEYDNILLKEWEMGKNKLYNLLSEWNKFVEDNKIAQHDVVQLWSFRKRSKLCFALVKVDPALISSSLIIHE